MTEEEAKTKWCFRAPDAANDRCIGSACMAWRWVMEHIIQRDGTISGPTPSQQGYCGLAGKP